MAIYFKITDLSSGPALYCKTEEAQQILLDMAGDAQGINGHQKYTFQTVYMSQQEYENLPDFNGF
jgi:hypothetical protein